MNNWLLNLIERTVENYKKIMLFCPVYADFEKKITNDLNIIVFNNFVTCAFLTSFRFY